MNEEELYRKYLELKERGRDALAEADQVKAEITDLMLSGVSFCFGGRGLKLSYETRTTFDLDLAVKLGYLTPQQVAECQKATCYPVMRDVKMDDTEAERQARLNALRGQVSL